MYYLISIYFNKEDIVSMQFCNECGASLTQDAIFCKECGTPVVAKAQSTLPANSPKPSQPMNPKTKKLLIAGVVCLGVLFGGYKIGESLTDKDRKIEKLQTALIEKDSDAIANILVSTDKKLKVDKDSLKGLMKYLDKNPDVAEDVVATLKEQSMYYDTVKSSSKISQEHMEENVDTGLFNLRKTGKTLFYDKYEIMIKPVYISLYTNYQDTVLKVNGKKVATSDTVDYDKTVGPYLPGIYSVEAELKNDFVTLKDKQEVFLSGVDTQDVGLYLEGEDVTLYSDYSDAEIEGKVLIDGKEVKVNPFAEESFGPVTTDGSLSVQVAAALPWGEMKSEEITIDDYELEFDLAFDEALQQKIMDTIVLNAQEWVVAYTSADTSKLTTVTSDYIDRYADNYSTEDKSSDSFYQVEYLGTNFDLDSFNLYYDDEQWRVSVDVQELYNSDYYNSGETPELAETAAEWTYKLVYDEQKKKWLIDSYSDSYGFYAENTKEHKEASPSLHTSKWGN